MQLIEVKTKTCNFILPNRYPQSIENGKLTYWIQGEGYTTTKTFKDIHSVMPELNTNLSWFTIACIVDQYGINVGSFYAENKVCGIYAEREAMKSYRLYNVIKHVIPNNFDQSFFDFLKVDKRMLYYNAIIFDISATNSAFSISDNDYHCVKMTYKDKTDVSFADYIEMKYGLEYVKIIDTLNQTNIIQLF